MKLIVNALILFALIGTLAARKRGNDQPAGNIRIYGNRNDQPGSRGRQTIGGEYSYGKTYDNGVRVQAHAGVEKTQGQRPNKNVGVEVNIPIGGR